jgi:hypothetical protein
MSDKKKKLQKNREEQKRWIIRVAVAFAINGLVIVWLIFGRLRACGSAGYKTVAEA